MYDLVSQWWLVIAIYFKWIFFSFMDCLNYNSTIAGIFTKILLVLSVGILAWAYHAIQPPPPKTCGSLDGQPVTASRIKLRDGRHLAYKEHGVPRNAAKYKIVEVHGFDSCRHDAVIPSQVFVCSFSLLFRVVVLAFIYKL